MAPLRTEFHSRLISVLKFSVVLIFLYTTTFQRLYNIASSSGVWIYKKELVSFPGICIKLTLQASMRNI